jgi:hypothetical protein
VTDLSVLAEPIIKGLPGVEKVSVTGQPGKRLIHILDWHFVDRDDFKIDMEEAHKRKLSKDELDEMYRDLLQEIEMVQIEQMGLIQCLRHHGIRSIYSEGYAVGEEKGFSEKVAALAGISNQYKETRRQLSDVRDIMNDPARRKQAQDLEKEVMSASAELKLPRSNSERQGGFSLTVSLKKFFRWKTRKSIKMRNWCRVERSSSIPSRSGSDGKRLSKTSSQRIQSLLSFLAVLTTSPSISRMPSTSESG